MKTHSFDDQDAELDPAEPREQATTHINVTSEEVSWSMGERRERWLEAGKKGNHKEIRRSQS